MATNVTARANKAQLEFSGIPGWAPRAKLKLWLLDIGEMSEERVSEDFDQEIGAGQPLIKNSETYTEQKANDGLDTRKGHRGGDLQSELDAGGFCTATIRGMTATVTFHEKRLQDRCEQAKWYAESKVAGGALLIFLKADAAMAEDYINERLAEIEAKETMKATRRQVRQLEAGVRVENLKAPRRGFRVRVA